MKLTKNFSRSEFDSHDGSDMPQDVLLNIQKLANQLQVLRDAIGLPIRINSGYRSPAHNKLIGGVSNSQHLLGKASDISVEGMIPKKVAEHIEKLICSGDMLQGGLGIYNTFCHYDIRKTKARWIK